MQRIRSCGGQSSCAPTLVGFNDIGLPPHVRDRSVAAAKLKQYLAWQRPAVGAAIGYGVPTGVAEGATEMLDWLNSAAVTFFGVPTSWAELLGFGTGMLCVLLVVRQHIANWPIGILNVLLLMVVFWSAGLYADSGLQIIYVVLGAYGWWHWRFGGADRTTLRVRRTTRTEWLALAVAGTALTGALWFFLDRFTNSTVPLPDALTTALSLLATYGQARKLVESWWLWIAADLIYIPLYGYKDLWLTAILYVGFLGLCVLGLRAWLADLRRITVAGARAMAPMVA